MKFLILVKSKSDHIHRRTLIRMTWSKMAEEKYNSTVLFIMGTTTTTNGARSNIIDEIRDHGDIMILNFTDTYYNLTYKQIGSLQWAVKFCSQAEHVVSADDDIILSMGKLSVSTSRSISINEK